MSFIQEINRRRTFGIISHPDAGKDHTDREIIVIWRCHPRSRCRKKQQDKERSYFGFYGN
jgi:peptide subunit release factor RF-3